MDALRFKEPIAREAKQGKKMRTGSVQETRPCNETEKDVFAVVQSRDSENRRWKEIAEVVSYTNDGAAVQMERECVVGRLVSVMMPMPVYLRAFDHEAPQYRIFGVVQYCQRLRHNGQDKYYVGIAFTGQNAPPSYVDNPEQNYRIFGLNDEGLWNIREVRSTFRKRADTRYWTAVDVYLAIVDGDPAAAGGEWTKTENISKSGASLGTSMDVNMGDRVKLISEEFDFSALAVVCNVSEVPSGGRKINLRFLDFQFPVDKLDRKA